MSFQKLSSVCTIIGGFAFKSKLMKADKGQYQIIKMSNLYQGAMDLTRNPSYIDDIESNQEKYLLKKGDILLTLTGTVGKKDYGYSVLICDQKNLLLNQRLCLLRPRPNTVNSYFLLQLLKSKRFLDHFFESSIGGTGNQTNVSINALKEIKLDIPPLRDQTTIANLLSTWDTAIEKIERLIAAKEKLLSAFRRRVFSKKYNENKSGWKKVRLSSVLIEHGHLSNGGQAVFSVSVHKGLVNQIEHLGRSFSASNTSRYNRVHLGDIVYTKSPTGEFPYGIVKQSLIDEDVIVSPLYGVFTPQTMELGTILDFYFESPVNARNYLHPIIQKGAKNTINITNKTFLSGKLILPLSEKEQKRIAGFLIPVRHEIGLLKKQLDAYRRQKRGLMQKLLTGQWRVKVKEN